jgi:TonB family protein
MKFIFALAICSVTFFARAQDTSYYNNDWEKINSGDGASYYEIVQHDADDTNKVHTTTYYKSGQKKDEEHYVNYSKRKPEGTSKTWYKDGQLRSSADYTNGKLNGDLLTYWEDGTPKRIDYFVYDSLVSGKCFNLKGKEIPHFDFEIMPQYPGGVDKLMQYLTKEVTYPKKARKKGIEGRVIVGFIVNKDGSVSDVKVVTSIDPELDEEAVRAVKSLPDWSPGMQDGEAVKVAYRLPVRFAFH